MVQGRRILIAAVLVMGFSSFAARAESNGAAEARAMLERTVASLKTDQTATLEAIVKGTDGFRKGDLYPFCARAGSGRVVAHPFELGVNLADQADKNGVMFGKEILNTAQDGVVKDIRYMWPKPGEKTPASKHTFYTKVGHLVCGVGYYN